MTQIGASASNLINTLNLFGRMPLASNVPIPNVCGSVKLNKRKFTAHLISMGIKDVLVGDRIITLGKFFQSNNEGLFGSTCP